ncbi:MAG: hypothetical protein JNJ58_02440 [Chitinophagaceae bacterium]|nr:hypothetical protein [Chitinophagaceae bacterium]
MKVLLFCLLCFVTQKGFSQSDYVYKDYSLDGFGQNIVISDFNEDGKPDTVALISNDSSMIAFMGLSGSGSNRKVSRRLDRFSDKVFISDFEGNSKFKITLSWMRYLEVYTFRYNAVQKDFELIGLDTEDFGNAAGDGSGKVSINFLTKEKVTAINHYNQREGKLETGEEKKSTIKLERKIFLAGFNPEQVKGAFLQPN